MKASDPDESKIGITREQLIDDFAIRSFRDTADQDYIAARMSYRAALQYPCLWQTQQTIEKYLKCILLLNRIEATCVGHDLTLALNRIEQSGKIHLGLNSTSIAFLRYIDEIGAFRYAELSTVTQGSDVIQLDRIAWELRRFCTHNPAPRQLLLEQGKLAPRYELTGGILESIILSREDPARKALLWGNAFLGKSKRRKIRAPGWIKARNAPLSMHPEILNDVLRYVRLPKGMLGAWRNHQAPY